MDKDAGQKIVYPSIASWRANLAARNLLLGRREGLSKDNRKRNDTNGR